MPGSGDKRNRLMTHTLETLVFRKTGSYWRIPRLGRREIYVRHDHHHWASRALAVKGAGGGRSSRAPISRALSEKVKDSFGQLAEPLSAWIARQTGRRARNRQILNDAPRRLHSAEQVGQVERTRSVFCCIRDAEWENANKTPGGPAWGV